MEKAAKGFKADTKSIVLCGLFAALSAVSAFIRIPMPVIPFTLQIPVVALAGMILGAKRAAISQAAYILVGLIGMPVFTKGGGPQYVFESTFGYLLGFIAMAYIVGYLSEKSKNQSFIALGIICVVGVLVSYVFGIIYMYFILNFYTHTPIGIWSAIVTGGLVFLPKDIILCFVTAFLASRIKPALNKYL